MFVIPTGYAHHGIKNGDLCKYINGLFPIDILFPCVYLYTMYLLKRKLFYFLCNTEFVQLFITLVNNFISTNRFKNGLKLGKIFPWFKPDFYLKNEDWSLKEKRKNCTNHETPKIRKNVTILFYSGTEYNEFKLGTTGSNPNH